MKLRQLVQSILFLMIVFVLLGCSTYIVRTNGDVKNRFTGFYAEPKNSIDVIMIGASPVATSFAPGQIWGESGITSYPLSTNSQNPKAMKYLLEEAYKYQSPGVVVIELRMFTEDVEKMEEDTAHIREVTDNLKFSLNRIRAINALVKEKEERYTYYFDIIKFHSNWKMFFLPEELKKYDYSLKNPDKGFEYPDEIMPHDKPENIKMDGIVPISKEQQETLIDLMEYLKAHDQKTLFVVTPKALSDEYQGMVNYMGNMVMAEGFDFLNMNEYYDSMQFDFHTDLMDGAHTNTLGAKKCSVFLADYLSRTYGIKDKKGQKEFQSYDISYERFLENYEKIRLSADDGGDNRNE